MGTNRVLVLNGGFQPFTLNETVDEVFRVVDGPDRGWFCTVNVAILMMMRADAPLQSFVDRSACTVADGQPIVWLARVFGTPLPERVAGIDLIEEICARAADHGQSVHLLGSSLAVVTEVAARLRAKYSHLDVSFQDGYFSESEGAERAAAIAASGARILIVGMGVPRQESFIEDHWHTMAVDVAVGVGGSFDVLAGLRTRAPMWMQRCGLEWVHRLREEPRRLFSRYFSTGLRFLFLGVRAIVVPRYRRV
jgi:N-acetylglucosaminyldiphosphoundecaprenol N-acetyl-beta-D-mannosaminyltransferase